jgi:enoyl-CoA hydratase/carnithine racemase
MTPQLTVEGRRATIRLDAPERRNALGPLDLRALEHIFDRIERDRSIDVAILTATRETFCSGYDLGELRAELESDAAAGARGDFPRMVDTLENLRVPTLCALRGGAYGGGTDLALACDFRIGTPRTTLAVPAARFGLTFYSGGLRRYVDRLGLDVAKRIFLLAEPLGANELLRVGFLHEIVEDDEIDARIERCTQLLLSNATQAVAALKRSLNEVGRGAADPATIDDAFADSFQAPDTVERLRRTSRRHDSP